MPGDPVLTQHSSSTATSVWFLMPDFCCKEHQKAGLSGLTHGATRRVTIYTLLPSTSPWYTQPALQDGMTNSVGGEDRVLLAWNAHRKSCVHVPPEQDGVGDKGLANCSPQAGPGSPPPGRPTS